VTGQPHAHHHHHEHPLAEEVVEVLVETALEHGDGGDGGAPSTPRSRATRLVTTFGLLIGVAAVAFVVRRLVTDWAQVSDELADAEVAWLVVAAVAAAIGMTSIGWGWRHVMIALGADVPLRRVVPWYYVGELGKYVPGGIWPVLGRGELARRGGVPKGRAFTSVALSLGMLYLAAMFTATAFLPFALSSGGGLSPWMLFLLALPVGVVLLHHEVLERLLALVSRVAKREVDVPVPRWGVSLGLVARYIPTWLSIGFATYAVARALSPDIDFAQMMFATILSWVVGFLAVPVPSGAGIRETVLFAASGAPEDIAIATAVAARIIFVVVDVGGAAICAPLVRAGRRRDAGADGR
jgi:uncharacterized membrane protein YbhN (UPF0104 family)